MGGLVIVAGLLVALSDSAAPSGATVEAEDEALALQIHGSGQARGGKLFVRHAA